MEKRITKQEMLDILLNEKSQKAKPKPLENGNDLMDIIIQDEMIDLLVRNLALFDTLIDRNWKLVKYCVKIGDTTEEELKYYIKVFADYGVFDEKETLKILGIDINNLQNKIKIDQSINSAIQEVQNKNKYENDIKANSNSYKNNIIPILMWHFGSINTCPIHNSKTHKSVQYIPCQVAPLYKNLYKKFRMEMYYCPKCNNYYISNKSIEDLKTETKYSVVAVKTIDFYDFVIERAKKNSLILKNTKTKNLNFSHYNYTSQIRDLGYSLQISKEERWNILIKNVLPNVPFENVIRHLDNQISNKSSIGSKDYSNAISEWEYDIKRLFTLAE